MERLVEVVQDLSLARSLERVQEVVRSAARELTGADDATFVLREGDRCFYADEDAFEPLWKGLRFPMSSCISGWVMRNRDAAVIEDIYGDPRIPIDAYRPTFVKSLAMVPIRTEDPIGAIGNYWATRHRVSREELSLLQALAHSASVALERVALHSEHEQRVAERTRELHVVNAELAAKNEALEELQRQKEELSALLVHDLRSPAATVVMSGKMRLRSPTVTDAERRHWQYAITAGETITRMAQNLLDVAKAEAGGLAVRPTRLELGKVAHAAIDALVIVAASRNQAIELDTPAGPIEIDADRELLQRVLQNLIDNGLRYSPPGSRVRVALRAAPDEQVELAVDDDGPGIAPELRERIFEKYVRLSGAGTEDIGRGLGLSFCRLAVEAHGGTIRAGASPSGGGSFRILLPRCPVDGPPAAG
jgi:signal transduction histidine kinase